MKKLSLILLLATTLFISCEKDPDNITVVLNGSGSLSIKVIDEQNNFLGVIFINDIRHIIFEHDQYDSV